MRAKTGGINTRQWNTASRSPHAVRHTVTNVPTTTNVAATPIMYLQSNYQSDIRLQNRHTNQNIQVRAILHKHQGR